MSSPVALNAPTAPTGRFVRGILFFNDKTHLAFEDYSDVPDGHEEVCIVGDISDSMNCAHIQAKFKLILAEQTKGTNAEGKFDIPEPSMTTAMVDAVAEAARRWPDAIPEVAGDGMDNHLRGEVVIGVDADGGEIKADLGNGFTGCTRTRTNHVAKHLANEHGAKLFYISLAAAANDLAETLAAEGVQTATINTTASSAQVVATYRAARTSHRAHRAANTSAAPRTVNRPSAARVVIHTSDEVNAIVSTVPDEEVGEVERTAGFIHVVSPDDATKPQVKDAIDAAMAGIDVTLKDEHKPMARAVILFYMLTIVGAMQPVPAAMLFGKYCGVFKEPNKSDIKKAVNKILCRLSGKGGPKFFSAGGKVPKDGAEMKINGATIKFPECPMYNCHVKKDIIEELMAEADWASPMDVFEKTKHSPKKRAREGPDETAVQPARAFPGAQTVSEAAAVAAAMVEA